jgi:hypothetical protein
VSECAAANVQRHANERSKAVALGKFVNLIYFLCDVNLSFSDVIVNFI